MAFLFDIHPQRKAPSHFAQIAIEQSIDAIQGLTYAIPTHLKDVLRVGSRVIIPLGRGNRPVAGYIIKIDTTCDIPKNKWHKIKDITSTDKSATALPPQLIQLASWIASYYCCPLGMTLQTMLPAAVKKASGQSIKTFVKIAEHYQQNPEELPKLSKLQKKIIQILQAQISDPLTQGWVQAKQITQQAQAKSSAPLKSLINKKIIQTKQKMTTHSKWKNENETSKKTTESQFTLTIQQQKALDQITPRLNQGFNVNLIQGVTGSGKTELYLRIIENTIKIHTEKQTESHPPAAIILVPEISLTPQTAARFHERFSNVAVLHSALTPTQRHQQWQKINQGKANIVVGARSAIFAPIKNLKLIIVDEEHDTSYKQDQLPRYNARDVAIKRAQISEIPCILGSATPSLESYHNTQIKKNFHLIKITQRVGNAKLPKVSIVDMAQQRKLRKGIHLLSQSLENLIHRTITQDHRQVILLLNRRGYANYIACPDHNCGFILTCNHCDTTMVYHKDSTAPNQGYLRCHHCTAQQILPNTCPTCHKKTIVFGLGTQRVEEEIQRKMPNYTHARMDSDVMRTAKDYEKQLNDFRNGKTQILIGTQMIAKGLDFPNVTLVGIVSADTAINMPDFRAAERTFQLISQVAGRAGRANHPGAVILQTFNPEEPTIRLAAEHDYDSFAQRELLARTEANLPPISRMTRIVTRHTNHEKSLHLAKTLQIKLQNASQQLKLNVKIIGPIPCPIARIADYHRNQIELIANNPSHLQKLITTLRNHKQLIADTHTAIDVDPISLL